MRKATRAILVALLTFLSTVVVGAAAVLTSAITLAATALIVPGTGTPNANIVANYMENARDRYMTSTPCTVANGCIGANLIGIDYPASFWPLGFPPFPSTWCPGLHCDTWNVSAGKGVANLNSAFITVLTDPMKPNEPIVIFGYSQGGAVVSNEMYNLAGLPQTTKDRITVVTIGNIEGPQGLWTRLSFIPYVPILNVTPCCTLPTDIGIKSYNYNFEYDLVGDAPLYLFNPLAWLNAALAVEYVHGDYLLPNGNDPSGTLPYGYTEAELAAAIADPNNIRTYQDGTFILIPQKGPLPIMMPLLELADATHTTPLVKPIVDLFNPIFKVIIDLGYDRTANPGIPQTLKLFPIVNPITLAIDLVVAAGEGIEAAWNDITGNTSGPAATLAPSGPSILAADNDAKLAQAPVDVQKPDLTSPLKPLKRNAIDTSVPANPLKIDLTPKVGVDLQQPKPDAGGSSNPVFNLPKLPKPNVSAPTLPKLPKLPKPGNPFVPRVTELFPSLREAVNGLTTADPTPDPDAGEQSADAQAPAAA
jgi:hypothetical protein